MIDYDINILSSAREFVNKVIAPVAGEADETERVSPGGFP